MDTRQIARDRALLTQRPYVTYLLPAAQCTAILADMKKALFVVSAADHWTLADGSTHPTGYWAEELAVPHRMFREAGWQVDIATPGGVAPTVDETSLGFMGGLPGKRDKIRDYLDQIGPELSSPANLSAVDESSYDVVFYPGGHGPMEDLAVDEISGRLITQRIEADRPIAFLCHAPAAVFAATRADGSLVVKGRRMTGFSDLEEKATPAARKAKWTLESRLKENGVEYEKATLPMRPHVVVDGALYSGQNPASSEKLAEQILADLGN